MQYHKFTSILCVCVFGNIICNNGEFALKGSRTLSEYTCLVFFLFAAFKLPVLYNYNPVRRLHPRFILQRPRTMEGLAIVLVALLSLASSGRAGFESIPFGLYEDLRNGSSEQCRIDVNKMLDGANNLDRWALESWFSVIFFFFVSTVCTCFMCSYINTKLHTCR